MTKLKIDSSKFKNMSIDEMLEKIKKEAENNKDIKDISQNQAIEMLEQTKENEKDKKIISNIDYLIQLIKQFFAKKFDANVARKSVLEKLKNQEIVKKIREKIEKNPEIINLAKKVLGSHFVDTCIKNFGLTKQAQINNEKNCNTHLL